MDTRVEQFCVDVELEVYRRQVNSRFHVVTLRNSGCVSSFQVLLFWLYRRKQVLTQKNTALRYIALCSVTENYGCARPGGLCGGLRLPLPLPDAAGAACFCSRSTRCCRSARAASAAARRSFEALTLTVSCKTKPASPGASGASSGACAGAAGGAVPGCSLLERCCCCC
jgi:hypothetical protein